MSRRSRDLNDGPQRGSDAYDRLEIDDDFYGSERELELLHFLDHLNIVGYLCKSRVLKFGEILPTVIGYATIRAWDNRTVRHYLEHIREIDHADGYAAVSGFPHFEWLGQRIAALKTAPSVPIDARVKHTPPSS